MSLFGFGPSATVQIKLEGEDARLKYEQPAGAGGAGDRDSKGIVIYQGHEPVQGTVMVILPSGRKMDHLGIKVEMIGQIELTQDKVSQYEFTSLVRELAAPGTLERSAQFHFDFNSVDKAYESYTGLNVRLRYFLRVTVARQYASNMVEELDFWVQNVNEKPEINNSIKMEVGIEDCLHIEFEYDKSKYHLKDVIIGKIYFLLVRIKIKHMELAIIRRETCGSGSDMTSESKTVTKFEVMDGAPVRGESVPVRVFLSGFELTPTFRNVNNKFSVKYYLNIVLVDEDERRYFKQQEITLWRNELG